MRNILLISCIIWVQNRQATLANVAHLEHLDYEWCGVRSWGGPDIMKMPRLHVVLAQMW